MDPRKAATITDYSQISTLYAEDFGRDYEHFEFIDKALARLKQTTTLDFPIVDLGCGPGTVTDYLFKKNIRTITAIDFTPSFY